jgi:hypothetical protein
MPPAPQSPLRIGILGTADIARSFIEGVRPSKSVVVSSVASRSLDKELIASGAIGRVQTVQAAFGFTVADANNIRLFFEYEAVLLLPEHRTATGLDAQDIEGFLAAFASAAEPVDLNFL